MALWISQLDHMVLTDWPISASMACLGNTVFMLTQGFQHTHKIWTVNAMTRSSAVQCGPMMSETRYICQNEGNIFDGSYTPMCIHIKRWDLSLTGENHGTTCSDQYFAAVNHCVVFRNQCPTVQIHINVVHVCHWYVQHVFLTEYGHKTTQT